MKISLFWSIFSLVYLWYASLDHLPHPFTSSEDMRSGKRERGGYASPQGVTGDGVSLKVTDVPQERFEDGIQAAKGQELAGRVGENRVLDSSPAQLLLGL